MSVLCSFSSILPTVSSLSFGKSLSECCCLWVIASKCSLFVGCFCSCCCFKFLFLFYSNCLWFMSWWGGRCLWFFMSLRFPRCSLSTLDGTVQGLLDLVPVKLKRRFTRLDARCAFFLIWNTINVSLRHDGRYFPVSDKLCELQRMIKRKLS